MSTVIWAGQRTLSTCEGILRITAFPLSREPSVTEVLDIELPAPELDPASIAGKVGTRRCHPSDTSVT
jgi:hypothetical protein